MMGRRNSCELTQQTNDCNSVNAASDRNVSDVLTVNRRLVIILFRPSVGDDMLTELFSSSGYSVKAFKFFQ